MIERYTLPDMGRIWSEENKFQKWLEIEILVCEALASGGEIPHDAVERIRSNASFDPHRIKEIEETTHHDVIAFLTNVGEHVGKDSRFIHANMSTLPVSTSWAITGTRPSSVHFISSSQSVTANTLLYCVKGRLV